MEWSPVLWGKAILYQPAPLTQQLTCCLSKRSPGQATPAQPSPHQPAQPTPASSACQEMAVL